MEGHRAATGYHDLSPAWFDGIALLEESVEDAMYKVNTARSDARVMRRKGPM